MRIVVDTNMMYSAILNTSSKIAKIILNSKPSLNFYSTEMLLTEIEEHKDEIKDYTEYSDFEFNKIVWMLTKPIHFINVKLIPKSIIRQAEELTRDVDIDDMEFVALTEHLKGHLWSGDGELKKGLLKKNWNKIITTDILYEKVMKK
jgi:predicted nucleic acid-binding protein